MAMNLKFIAHRLLLFRHLPLTHPTKWGRTSYNLHIVNCIQHLHKPRSPLHFMFPKLSYSRITLFFPLIYHVFGLPHPLFPSSHLHSQNNLIASVLSLLVTWPNHLDLFSYILGNFFLFKVSNFLTGIYYWLKFQPLVHANWMGINYLVTRQRLGPPYRRTKESRTNNEIWWPQTIEPRRDKTRLYYLGLLPTLAKGSVFA